MVTLEHYHFYCRCHVSHYLVHSFLPPTPQRTFAWVGRMNGKDGWGMIPCQGSAFPVVELSQLLQGVTFPHGSLGVLPGRPLENPQKGRDLEGGVWKRGL